MRRLPSSILPILLLALCGLSASRAAAQAGPEVAPSWEAPGPYPDRVVLTLSTEPATSQSVTWRTDTTVTGTAAEIALATPSPAFGRQARTVAAETERLDTRHLDREEGEHVVALYHSVTFSGLEPDTLYAYRVGGGQRWSEWFHFRTASTEPKPFSFVYFGDAQNSILSLWSRAIRGGYAEAPDARFMIHAGDLVNSGHSSSEWGEWFTAGGWIHSMMPSFPVPGNHEYKGYTKAESQAGNRHLSVHWRPQFTLPENGVAGLEETSYYVDYQGARIIGLDSNRRIEEQAAWLERVLADNPNRWTVVTFHHPVFSSAQGRDNPEVRRYWKPILEKHRVDLVLQGHDHTYARGRTYASEQNVAQGVNARNWHTGTVYVISVSGGKMYELDQDWMSRYEVIMDRTAEDMQLYQVVRVAGDTLRYQAFTATGQLYDAFDLVKQEEGPNRFVERVPPDRGVRMHESTVP